MLPQAGERFGPYEILARLGGGGMGVVFRAWDERLHREVAIKLLHEEVREPVMRRRFLLEARAASALAHPHICTVFDFGEQDGEPYLVMELLEGETLRNRIAQRACSADEIVRYGKQIVEALGAAHAKGIVHRDIKPANIFLQSTAAGECIKILDFGLAKVSMALRSGRDSRVLELTSRGSTVGTLAYMSPEQARGEALDPRTDLFSTGIVLYEMAARRTPFQAETAALAFQALLSRPPEPIRTWNAAVPREVDRIITRLLSKDRSERYPNALAVQHAFDQLLARGKGEWLRKLPAAAVPLVRAPDPVLRTRRPKAARPKPASAASSSLARAQTDATANVTPPELDPSRAPGGELLRPRRLPRQEKDSRETKYPGEGLRAEPSRGDRPKHAVDPPEVVPSASHGSVEQGQIADKFRPNGPGEGVGPRKPAINVGSSAAVSPRTASLPEPQSSSTVPAIDRVGSGPAGAAQTGEVRVTDPFSRRSSRTPGGSSGSVPAAPARVDSSRPEQEGPVPQPVEPGRSAPMRWLVIIASLILVTGLLSLPAFKGRSGDLGRISIGPSDRLLLGPIVNRTGHDAFNPGVEAGLQLWLDTHSQLSWLGAEAYRAGQRVLVSQAAAQPEGTSPQAVARSLHARVYTHGELKQESSHFVLRVDIFDAATNDHLGSVEEDTVDAENLPVAIQRAAQELQRRFGETERQNGSSPADGAKDLPDMAALAAFGDGEAHWADSDVFRAIESYRRAADLAPDFAQAHLRLAWLYAGQGAELAAEDRAVRASSGASRRSERLQRLARVTRLTLVDQDLPSALQAARQAAAERPRDADALSLLATVNRLSGHMTEALLAAQKALSADPYSVSAADEAAFATIGLNRFDEARSIGEKARARGVLCQCGQQLLNGTEANLSGGASPATSQDLRPSWQRAVVMEENGNTPGAKALWHRVADVALAQAGMESAAPAALATEALNEALHGDCGSALGSVHQASLLSFGRGAAYHLALASAVCGSLRQVDGQAALRHIEAEGHPTPVGKNLELPLVHGTDLLANDQPAQAAMAFTLLPTDREASPLSLYLHGAALGAVQASTAAATALTLAEQRQGYSLLTGTPVASLSQRLLLRTQLSRDRPPRPSVGHAKVN